MRIAITGGGIAGLTAALALARAGFDVGIFERSPALSEVGAGVQISPNAGRILESLGLGAAIDSMATRPRAIEMRSARSGAPIVSLPLAGGAARYGTPYRLVHRADLQAVLLDAVVLQPGIRLAFDAPVAHVEETGGAVGFLVNGERERADLLIGADGVRSAVRAHLRGGPARLSGRTAWRATGEAASVPAGIARDATTVFLGERLHVVLYPIRAGALINIVIVIEEDWQGEGWSEPADRLSLISRFDGQAPILHDLIGGADGWTRWALGEVDPDGPWTGARVALIGDAAHAMLPFLAQGAAMAIEDAAVLADELARSGTTPAAALSRYRSLRQPRVARVWRAARQSGAIYHLGGPAGVARNLAMRSLGGARLLRRYDWIYGWTSAG